MDKQIIAGVDLDGPDYQIIFDWFLDNWFAWEDLTLEGAPASLLTCLEANGYGIVPANPEPTDQYELGFKTGFDEARRLFKHVISQIYPDVARLSMDLSKMNSDTRTAKRWTKIAEKLAQTWEW